MKREDRKRESHTHICHICGQDIYPDEDYEYVKTRRRTELWMHERCMETRRKQDGGKEVVSDS